MRPSFPFPEKEILTYSQYFPSSKSKENRTLFQAKTKKHGKEAVNVHVKTFPKYIDTAWRSQASARFVRRNRHRDHPGLPHRKISRISETFPTDSADSVVLPAGGLELPRKAPGLIVLLVYPTARRQHQFMKEGQR